MHSPCREHRVHQSLHCCGLVCRGTLLAPPFGTQSAHPLSTLRILTAANCPPTRHREDEDEDSPVGRKTEAHEIGDIRIALWQCSCTCTCMCSRKPRVITCTYCHKLCVRARVCPAVPSAVPLSIRQAGRDCAWCHGACPRRCMGETWRRTASSIWHEV